ncbi:hypothetical protein [Georgenia satyanarayanai]|uniref:hypothetical protein n=1 Tax=Georgenia satyanarayanai TaxID=860221 RepID=UPI0011B55230|nr:hypothetical protein [Georgenia satyanarayanai]
MRELANADHPPSVPLNPMGALPCIARLEDETGSSWWVAATANRWTTTHVLVLWRPDPRNHRQERLVWLRKADVRPWLHKEQATRT